MAHWLTHEGGAEHGYQLSVTRRLRRRSRSRLQADRGRRYQHRRLPRRVDDGPDQPGRAHHELVAVREDLRRLHAVDAPRARGLRLLQQRRLALLRRQRRRARVARHRAGGRPPARPRQGRRQEAGAPKPAEKKRPAARDGLYIGKDSGPGARTGLKCFEEIDEISIVAAPGQTSPAVQDALLIALRDPQGSLRDSRLAGDDARAASTSCPRRATPSTARTTSRGSRSTTRSAATSSFRRRATSPASTRAPTTSAASTRRRPTRSSAARSASSTTSPRASRTSSTRRASTASA